MRFLTLISSFFFFWNITLFAQIDSLTNRLLTVDENQQNEIKIKLGRAYLLSDLSETKRLSHEVINSVNSDTELAAQANDLLGRYYFYSSKLDSAALHFDLARSYHAAHGNKDKEASIGISLGSVYLRAGQYTDASETLLSSASYFQSIDDEINLSKCYSNLAAAMAEIGNLKEAIEYNESAIQMMKTHNMSNVLMIALPNLATQYFQNGDSALAIKTYIDAESLASEADNKRSLALIYNNLGELYQGRGEINTAKDYINRSISLKKGMGQIKGLEEAYYNLGLIEQTAGNSSKALLYYDQAMESMVGIGQIKIMRALSQVHENLGNLNASLSYERRASALDQELNLAKLNEELNDMTQKYESIQKDNEILQLSSQNRQLEISKIKNRSWGIIATVGLLGSLGILYFLILSNRRKQYILQQKHIDQLKRKDEEIIEKMIMSQEAERNRIASDLHDSLGSKLATLKRFIEGLIDQHNLKPKAINLADESYQELRSISHSINSGVLTDKGLIPAIERMAENVTHSRAIKIKLSNQNMSKRLPAFKEIQIFRILQEIITNAIKHSNGDELKIKVSENGKHLNIEVLDNGKGFDLKKAKRGIGLRSIEQRLQSINADSDIKSNPKGTIYQINVPV